ncbi:RND family efflux transporter, MFP subunit [Vibrio gazogenes DSM 21264]|uniref:RND family efflux transporter, MFP subunit n=2 Tax=Vibrio gazogenes TaxID=687 RepID=A0A1M4XV44_VIBGA|nr:RND family efflux transporter, MFP subunit [Vibrio gazogenes DSM 21264] [Vibrio gazogenes DSM 21264 = NBRC 103151]SJN57905.1 putative efflux pump membrane fusion protein [Vibrio gazogenes]
MNEIGCSRMDIQKKQSRSIPKRKLWFALIVVVLVTLGAYATTMTSRSYEVRRDSIIISQVNQGDMSIEVRGNGVLAPKHIRWISTNVDGRVESVLVKPGAIVKKGDLIAELINPGLVQKTDEIRWELEAALADNKSLAMRHENNVLDAQARILKVKHSYEKAKLQYDAESTLLKRNNGSVSLIDYNRSKLDLEQYREQLQIEKERLEKLKETQEAEFQANTAMVNKLKKSLSRAEMMIQSLKVVSNQSGVIQAVNIEAGQRVPLGLNIAKLARQDQLLAELKIPERQVRTVEIGQDVIIDTHNNQIHGSVIRIDPAVNNGTVQVDVSLNHPLPPEARPDLSIEGTILVSKLQHVLSVNRPAFAQSNSPGTVYRLAANGREADKIRVMFGQGSADRIEIKSGLRDGDQIVTSNPSAWEHQDRISIQ